VYRIEKLKKRPRSKKRTVEPRDPTVISTLSPDIKRPGHEADHSLPSIVKERMPVAVLPLLHPPS
jgi:hypothetical protein